MTLHQLLTMNSNKAIQWLSTNQHNFTLVPNTPNQGLLNSNLSYIPSTMIEESAQTISSQYKDMHEHIVNVTKFHFS